MGTAWYVLKQGQSESSGPVSASELKQMAASGNLTPTDYLKRDGIEWVEASAVKGLFAAAANDGGTDLGLGQSAAAVAASAAASAAADSLRHTAVATKHLVYQGASQLKQHFTAAFSSTVQEAAKSLWQLLRHPLRFTFLTLVFIIASALSFGGLVTAIMFPVLVMGYIAGMQQQLKAEPLNLREFISFMRHGWDSLWHLLMMLAAFFVTLAAMISPAVIALLALYLFAGTLGAAYSEFSFHGSASSSQRFTVSNESFDRYAYRDHASEKPGAFSRLMSRVGTIIVNMFLFVVITALLTPLSAAFIMFFFMVFKVSQAPPNNDERRFDLVYLAFGKMLDMARANWKQLLISGLFVSLVFMSVIGLTYIIGSLFVEINMYAMAIWTPTVLMPLLLIIAAVYVNVFIISTCLVLGERSLEHATA